MRSISKLAPVNLALISVYFAPVWGRDAVRALISPFGGFEDRAQTAVASYVRQLFDLGLDGLMRVSNVLAVLKLVIAAGFVAYLIEFARALVVEREPDRGTIDAVLGLAVTAIAIWGLPALVLDDPSLIRAAATQVLLVAGAVILVMVERHIEQSAPQIVKAVPQDAPKPTIALADNYKERLNAWRAARSGEGAR